MKIFCSILFVFFIRTLSAQELFPLSEPASTVPKNVLGIRAWGNTYTEEDEQRNLFALKAMYGLTSKLTIMAIGTVGNHHGDYLPANLITHTHDGDQTIYEANDPERGLDYDYKFNGMDFYAKYRFLTNDGEKKHFRMAAYGEASFVDSPHDEAEPTLMDDTKGFGAGVIATYLNHHYAMSLTTGVILPGDYEETRPDPAGGELNTKISYGRALVYNFSAGYLLYPYKYKSYSEININAYVELLGKSYQDATIVQNNTSVEPQTEYLKSSSYVDIYPSVQVIFNSNLRIDIGAGFPLLGKSYVRNYPVFMLGIQRYFFL